MVSQFFAIQVFLLCVVGLFGEQEGKLVMVQEIFRHGARLPFQIVGIGDEYAAEEQSKGELTSEGKTMHYLLGKKMYEIYWDKLFAGTPFQYRYNQSKFLVKSTNYNRTIQSAQSHLLGILESLPPLNITENALPYSAPPFPDVSAQTGPVYGQSGKYIHPIPIHSTQKNMTAFQDGDFLARWYPDNCPNMRMWSEQNMKTKVAKKILSDKRFVDAVKELEEALGKPMNTANFSRYYDNLICMYTNGKPVPSIFSQPSQTQRTLNSLFGMRHFLYYASDPNQAAAISNDLIAETIANIEGVRKDEYSSPQWVVYSCHDLNIAAIFSVFNLSNIDCLYDSFVNNRSSDDECILEFPTFASNLVFEIYKYTSGYTFKINYNGVYRKIPFCSHKLECPVQKLYQFYSTWRISNIRSACGAPYYYTREMLFGLSAAIIAYLIWLAAIKAKGTTQSQNQQDKKDS